MNSIGFGLGLAYGAQLLGINAYFGIFPITFNINHYVVMTVTGFVLILFGTIQIKKEKARKNKDETRQA